MHEEHVGNSSKPTNDDEVIIDTDPTALSLPTSAPEFLELPASAQSSTLKSEIRRIPIPPHRMTPLKKDWINIFGPLTEILGLQVRMNVQRKCVEARVCASQVHV
jgi:RNA-binding protein PNO1